MKRIGTLLVLVAMTAVVARPLAAADGPKGVRGDILTLLGQEEDKIVSLAEKMPVDKYAWRPAPGVRSVGECFMHVAFGNYLISKFAGAEPPKTFSPEMQKETDKTKILAALKESFAFAKKTVSATPDAKLENPVDFFGTTTTVRGVLMSLNEHASEHLGQAIAYARSNGVTPPWSEKAAPAK